MRRHPHLYEINTRVFLHRMSAKYGRHLTLAAIPDEEWKSIAGRGFDLVWLMGVWQRSPGARRAALQNRELRRELDSALPGWKEGDVDGSPYAVYGYDLDDGLGDKAELAQLKSKLNAIGLGLILDFVPNHLALDHPWTISHPQRFVAGKATDAWAHPGWFYQIDGGVYFAHGRDPNFPPWSDTVQVNFYSADMREALTCELQRIASVADGVRCDMAMLAVNRIFGDTWGKITRETPPATEFWSEAIERVKHQRPDFQFLAEVYWGFERELQHMGFDFTYDKPFYDRLRSSTPSDVRSHLLAGDLYQKRSTRFIENHDEARAVVAFGRERSLAAAAVIATVPGLRFFHDGQLEGRRVRLPVQLVREPEEADDAEIMQFYRQLLSVCNEAVFHDGECKLVEVLRGNEHDEGYCNLLAWVWNMEARSTVVVVNFSEHRSRGWLEIQLPLGDGSAVAFRELMSGDTYTRDAGELRTRGLHVDLGPWQVNILEMTAGQ